MDIRVFDVFTMVDSADPDDTTLVYRACRGDRDAFAALVERHYGLIYRMSARILGDPIRAEDLAQDICVALVAKLPSFRGESRFTTWLCRVVINAAHDSQRRDKTRRRKEQEFAETDALLRADHAVRAESSAWLRQALGRLSEDMRLTLVLVLEEGLPHGEAGEVLGVSEGTVSWRMHEARKRLRVLAAEDGEVVS